MMEVKTRSERHAEEIERFLKSKSTVMVLLLYGSEIRKLEKKFPILISKSDKHDDLYNCLLYKKNVK